MPKSSRADLKKPVNCSQRRLLIGSLLGVGLLGAVFAAFVGDDAGNLWRRAHAQVDSVDALAAQMVDREIALYDLALEGAVRTARTPQVADTPLAMLRSAMFARAATLRGLGAMSVVDDKGRVFLDAASDATSANPRQTSVADRDFFLAQRFATGDRGLFVGAPFEDDGLKIGLSRRILRSDGGFAGAAIATLSLTALQTLLDGIRPEPDGAIELSALDGAVLVRASGDSPDPGIRIASSRQVGNRPFRISVELPAVNVLRPWMLRSAALGLALLLVGGSGLLVLRRLGRDLGQRASADRALAGLAKTDGLTGLANRRSFDEKLDLEWRRAERDASSFSLLMLDGDCFKAYNDTFGHVKGDKALKAIADTLRRTLQRPGDLAARYGGEEFAVLLPATDQASALLVAERIRQSVFDLGMNHPRNPYGIATVSVGLATVKPRYVGHPSTLVRAADHALYEAKAAGRNRVVAARAPDATGQPETVAA